jgi:hypothetical protein
MTLTERLQGAFFKNPFAWLLLIAFAVAEYGNYERGKELERVCDLIGPNDVWVEVPRTAKEEIDKICISRQQDD